jgi:hypothetical protein
MGLFTIRKIYKRWIDTKEGDLKFYKAQRIFRIATMCLALVLEISCATFLADHYCYYWGVKETVTMRRVSQTVACKWQMFGFRMVYVVVYFPIDFIMMLVVIRYCKDIIFNHNLYQLVKRTIIVED